jgi:hypothetical protein
MPLDSRLPNPSNSSSRVTAELHRDLAGALFKLELASVASFESCALNKAMFKIEGKGEKDED